MLVMKKLIVPVLVMLAMAVYAQEKKADDAAAKPAAPAAVEIKGKVSVAKDEAGAVKEVKITADDAVVYTVKQNAEGKKVAAMDGKDVVIKGVVDAATKTVTVQKCEEVKAEAPVDVE